ncbi:MAG: WD40-repeat-containing domain protein [Benniella sp.]|nr:MAG: WD40-repeat-containing domain protein [Benniella sp.]
MAPLKSALKKTATTATTTSESAKRKHTPASSADSQSNKRSKTVPGKSNVSKAAGGQKANGATKKKVTHHAPPTKKNPTTRVKAATVVNKPKKVPVIPEGATLEDFRIVAGTYENILYGVDAYWNEVQHTLTSNRVLLSPIFIFAAHIGCIKSLAIGGHFLASGSTDEKIQLYDLRRRKELGALLQHQGTITSLNFHNKTHMLSGSDDGKVCVWRSKDWECLKIMKGHQGTVHSIAIHPSGKIALSVSADRSVRLWNLLLGKQASMTRLQAEGLKVAWNPSGTGYSIMFDQELGIYDMATAKCIRTIKTARKTRMNTITYYKDDYIVIGYEDKMIRVYNTATGDIVKTLVGHTARVKALDLVNMVDVLISVSSDGTILTWNLEDVVAPATDAEAMNMKNHIGEHKTDMRVTCLSVQKGIWKNVGVESAAVDGDEDEGMDNDEPLGDSDGQDEDEVDDKDDEEDDDEDEDDD